MKGAIAELCAKTTRAPNTNKASSIGVNHHHLLLQKNAKSSPTMPVRFTSSSINRIRPYPQNVLICQRRLIYQVISQNKSIHSAASKGVKSFFGSIDDRFPP